ncbi:hypothetical protein [Aeoliella mucimassa]|uniref:Caspase domain protein n=1 Tax=Aeoliella mucimassa TaxID=2527972 RepID=A0A518AKW2_9BACT|nr:hypothetical protein [Aeoliella mucimassa]QDU55369.1 hypothetical protein Pan181_15580 [Aeoliella mucimassa]
MRSPACFWLLLMISGWLMISDTLADDHFLTIGGGYDPQGNQVSLERNVEFFRQVLAEQRPDDPAHTVFFADGDDDHRDLQYRDPSFECSPGRRIAIELFGDADDLDIAYRNHSLSNVTGSTSPGVISNYLEQLGRRVEGDDRLIVYATAHGGSGDEKTPHNTSVYTWNHRRFSAAEFSNWLGKLPEETPVVLVMVQCYAGGFAHTMFNEADPTKGIARQLRAGFFAQVHDRPAAGCTPGVNEESYQEYSSFFWAAIAGHDRLGSTIDKVDIDSDGVTSFAEAHAYAVCESETVDIPIRTSDAYLDYFSTDGNSIETQYHRDRKTNEPRRLPLPELQKLEGSLPALLEQADPVDRYIVECISKKLSLDLDGNVSQVKQALNRVRRDMQRARRSSSRTTGNYRRTRDRVLAEVRREWPELDSDLSPMLASLMAERADEFEKKVTSMLAYKSMVRLAEEKSKADEAVLNYRKDEALVLRLDRTLKRIVLSINLPKVGSPQVVNRYKELLALESSSLAAGSP